MECLGVNGCGTGRTTGAAISSLESAGAGTQADSSMLGGCGPPLQVLLDQNRMIQVNLARGFWKGIGDIKVRIIYTN